MQKKRCLKMQSIENNMPFSIITMVWAGEHRAFIVRYFVTTESYVAVQRTFCQKFKLRRHNWVLSCITISKRVKTFWETSAATSVRVVERRRSKQTAENCEKWRAAVRVTLQTSLYWDISLLHFSLSRVHKMIKSMVLGTVNCSSVERDRFGKMERFLRTVFVFAITRRCRTFF